jgi:hypothetical protein
MTLARKNSINTNVACEKQIWIIFSAELKIMRLYWKAFLIFGGKLYNNIQGKSIELQLVEFLKDTTASTKPARWEKEGKFLPFIQESAKITEHK